MCCMNRSSLGHFPKSNPAQYECQCYTKSSFDYGSCIHIIPPFAQVTPHENGGAPYAGINLQVQRVGRMSSQQYVPLHHNISIDGTHRFVKRKVVSRKAENIVPQSVSIILDTFLVDTPCITIFIRLSINACSLR